MGHGPALRIGWAVSRRRDSISLWRGLGAWWRGLAQLIKAAKLRNYVEVGVVEAVEPVIT
jgi:hypothetical protein